MFPGIDAEDYHASPGISTSKLKLFAEPGGPAKVRYGRRKDTEALKFGSLFHTAVLEPHLLEDLYCPTNLDRAGTKAWDAAQLAAGGRELVKIEIYEQALRMRDAVSRHPGARQLNEHPRRLVENSFWWTDPATGLLRRGRADGLIPDWHIIYDFKSCVDADLDSFSQSIGNYRYHWQDVGYKDGVAAAAGWQPEVFVFIAVEKDEPHLIGFYEIPAKDQEIGRDEVRVELRRWLECERTDTWPGYPEELTPCPLPKRYLHSIGAA